MIIERGKKIRLKKVLIKDLYLSRLHGVNLKHAHNFTQILIKKPGCYFEPLMCEKDGDRYCVKEGHHRYIAYLALKYRDCWIAYVDAD